MPKRSDLANAVRNLNLAHEADDPGQLRVRESRNRGHVSEWPVMGTHPVACCQDESHVAVVARFVDLVDERWCNPRPPLGIGAVAGCAVGGEGLLTGFGFGWALLRNSASGVSCPFPR